MQPVLVHEKGRERGGGNNGKVRGMLAKAPARERPGKGHARAAARALAQ